LDVTLRYDLFLLASHYWEAHWPLLTKKSEAIGDWLCRRRQELEEYYHKALEKLVAILTPYSAQKGALRKSFEAHGTGSFCPAGAFFTSVYSATSWRAVTSCWRRQRESQAS
jgi:hypothetical protein